jgi:hypothetical protein
VVGTLSDPLGTGIPHARSAAAVVGSRRRRTSSAVPAATAVLVGVGRPAFFRQVPMAASCEASTLGRAGVPVTVTEGTVGVDEAADGDVDALPDEAFEQAVIVGTASAVRATTGASVRNGATVPPRLGVDLAAEYPVLPRPMSDLEAE